MPREASASGIERLASLQRLLQAIVSADDGAAMVARGFADRGIDPADAELLAGTDRRKLLVYRKLVRGNLIETVQLQIPLTAARLGDDYASEVHAFCTEELPRSPILRDAAFEMVRWAAPRWRKRAAYLPDLARYELLEFDVYAAERMNEDLPPPGEDLPPEMPVRFDGSCRLGRFDFAVHALPDDPSDRTVPAPGPTIVLGYRDQGNHFRRMTLTPLAGDILERLLLGRAPLAEAVRGACESAGRAIDAEVIDGTSKVLADLAERGALLGPDHEPERPRPVWLDWLCRGTRGE